MSLTDVSTTWTPSSESNCESLLHDIKSLVIDLIGRRSHEIMGPLSVKS